MSELSRKADTPAENQLQNLISSIRPRVSAKFNERIPFESGRAGSAYLPDAIIEDFLILEAEGKGSASADNKKRDEELKRLGKRVVHLPNRILRDSDGRQVIYQFVVLIAELRSAFLKRGMEESAVHTIKLRDLRRVLSSDSGPTACEP